MRNQALERSLRLLRLLSRGRRTLDGLARDLGVCTRTIRRDLDVLSVAGFAVERSEGDYGDSGYWHVWYDGQCPVCQRVAGAGGDTREERG